MDLRVIFVDDEKRVLDGLRRGLRAYRGQWEMAFAHGPERALELLGEQRFDAIVSDMRMPGMDGAQLLHLVRERYPWMVRMILSGHSELDMVLRAVGTSHQYLTKPCEPEHLVTTVSAAFRLQTMLADEELKRVAAGMSSIPSQPELYQRLITALQDPDVSIGDVADLIAQDAGMTAQLLRLINSAYFGLCSEVSDPKRAVNLLGLSTISTLVLNLHIFQSFDEDQIHRAELGGIWSHGLLTARCAKEIARSESDDQLQIDESFSAGLLHDTGRLILAVNASAEYLQARDKAADGGTTLSEAEEEHVGVNHAHFGAYLMNLWGLPSSVVEAIAYHHTPSESPTSGFKPLVAVHVANAIATELQPPSWGSRDSRIDGDFLRQAGLADRVSVWRELCENALELEGAAQ